MKTQFGQEVRSLRADEDSFFRNDMDSPIPQSERAKLQGIELLSTGRRLPCQFEAGAI
jgi:hypothetical protein